MDFDTARFNMVEQQVRPWEVLDQAVLDRLAAVPRERFVPKDYRRLAYADTRIPLGNGDVMMPPREEGRLLQALALTARDHVLEVGTGSGYLAALAAGLSRRVTTVEISPERKARAEKSLAEFNNVDVIEGDAVRGWAAAAPYDAIAVTGSLPELDDAFLRQLKPGGRLFVVVGEAPRHGGASRYPHRSTGLGDGESLRDGPAAAGRRPTTQPVRILIPRGFRMNKRFGNPFLLSLGTAALLAAAPTTASAQRLDLAGAYRLAAENDPEFRAAAATRDAALESVAIARSGLRPNASFSGSASLEADDVNEPNPGSDTFSSLSLSLDVSQALYRLDRNIRLGRPGRTKRRPGSTTRQGPRSSSSGSHNGISWVLEAGDDYRFTQTNREAIAQQLRQAQQRFEVGLIAITDVEEAKSRFDLASAREIEAKNALDNARETMRESSGSTRMRWHPSETKSLSGSRTRPTSTNGPAPRSNAICWCSLRASRSP